MLHLVKMAVGCPSIEVLRDFQAKKLLARGRLVHQTRHRPKQADEILEGGSLYWVIAGAIRIRQRILDFESGVDAEGQAFCGIHLHPELVETRSLPWRAFQGWRYLQGETAPADLGQGGSSEDELPPALRQELRDLGLL
ncbi:MAG TPA: DUF1489 domain-containing protein [Stellaceae bacterium]|nr:DUF1489 domain-containing protein [Stellaceae bacterium]